MLTYAYLWLRDNCLTSLCQFVRWWYWNLHVDGDENQGAWGNDQSSERSGAAEGIPITSLEHLPPADLAAPSPHLLPLWMSLKRVPHCPISPGDVSFITIKAPSIKSCHHLVILPPQTSAKKRIPNVILYPVRAHISPWICNLLLLLLGFLVWFSTLSQERTAYSALDWTSIILPSVFFSPLNCVFEGTGSELERWLSR